MSSRISRTSTTRQQTLDRGRQPIPASFAWTAGCGQSPSDRSNRLAAGRRCEIRECRTRLLTSSFSPARLSFAARKAPRIRRIVIHIQRNRGQDAARFGSPWANPKGRVLEHLGRNFEACVHASIPPAQTDVRPPLPPHHGTSRPASQYPAELTALRSWPTTAGPGGHAGTCRASSSTPREGCVPRLLLGGNTSPGFAISWRTCRVNRAEFTIRGRWSPQVKVFIGHDGARQGLNRSLWNIVAST